MAETIDNESDRALQVFVLIDYCIPPVAPVAGNI